MTNYSIVSYVKAPKHFPTNLLPSLVAAKAYFIHVMFNNYSSSFLFKGIF
jgi:hypothetical protein